MPQDENTLSGKLSDDCFEVLDSLSDGVLLIDQDGDIIRVNRSLALKLGVSVQHLTGHFSTFLTNAEQFSDYLTLCRGTKNALPGAMTFLINGRASLFRCEGNLLKREGAHAIVMCRVIPAQAAVTRFLALNDRIDQLSREIARRQILERELREQQEWFQTTLSSIGDAVIATDDHGIVTFLNPEAEKLTGWQRQEALGQGLQAIFRIINEETRQPAVDPLQRVLAQGVVVGLANHTALITKAGREVAIEDSAAPIFNQEGRLIGVVLVFQNVTDKRRMEKELQQSRDRLYERVKELEQFHDAVVGRELKMIELEKDNARLRAKLAGQ
jgi:PAS domain S-box-containing protein